MDQDQSTAIMVCGHGSRDGEATAEFGAFVRALQARVPNRAIEHGYLEFATPTIRDGLAALKAKGYRHIVAAPGMLFAAGHVKNDLPWEVNSFAAANPELEVRYGRELGIDPKLLDAAAQRITSVLDDAVPRGETLLVVVGRGTNDPDANSNIAKVARMLWEGMGFGWAEIAFSGVATPMVDAALARAVKLGFKRIVVFPYFLFTGILVKRIYAQTDAAAVAFPDIQFVKAPYLADHPLVLTSFLERIGETQAGEAKMNCQLCKYREQVVGYEASVGAPQEGHHHHVRGEDHHHHHGHHHHHHHD